MNIWKQQGCRNDLDSPLFRPTRNNHTKELGKKLNPSTIYRLMKKYGDDSEVLKEVNGLTTHSLRASAATIALDHGAELSRIKDWMSTDRCMNIGRIYDP